MDLHDHIFTLLNWLERQPFFVMFSIPISLHVACYVCICGMYSVCEKRSQMISLRDWSGPQFYVSFHFFYFDSLNFAWEKDTGREPHTQKNLRDDVMELPGRAQAIWGWGRRVVNQWKSSFWLQSVQTPPLTSLLSFKWKPQSKSQCATRTKQATEIYLHSRAIKWKSTRNKYSSFSKMNQFQ